MACCPAPVQICTVGELVALLTNEIWPGAEPLAVGSNVTWNSALFPAGMVRGKLMPLTEYPLPLTLAEVTVTFELLAVSVPVLVVWLPMYCVPKASVVGETES